MKFLFVLILPFSASAVLGQSNLFNLGGSFPVGKGVGSTNGLLPFGYASSVVTGDFNRDGRVDVVTANLVDSTLSLLLGDGSGKFTSAPGFPMSINTGVQGVAAADFNGDGNLDLVVVGTDTVILLGDGKGAFTRGTGILPVGNFTYHMSGSAVVVADFNGDGKLDLLSRSGTQAYFATGDGTGGFNYILSAASTLHSGIYTGIGSVSQLATGDFNQDGKADVAAGVSDTSASNLTPLHVYLSGLFGSNDRFIGTSSRGPNTYGVAVGDFNGDGKLDAISSESSPFGPAVTTWLATGDWSTIGSAFQPIRATVPLQPMSLVVADFDGDGKLDWAGTTSAGTVMVELGDGKGGFTAAPGSPYSVGGDPFAFAVGDLNGDGKPDLVVDTGSTVVVLLNGVTVNGAQPQVIIFGAPGSENMSPSPVTITATASSGLPVTFTSNSPSVCTVSGNVLTLVGVGTCSITASQSGNATYSAATPVTGAFPVVQSGQRITFSAIPTLVVLGTAAITLNATVSSGLPVTFTAQPPTVCTVSANTLTFVGGGSCSVFATQPGNQNYLAAFEQDQYVFVYLPQTITFGSLPDRPLTSAPVLLTATASSALPVAFTSNTPTICGIAGSTATLTAGGVCSITASQSGNGIYAPAVTVTQSFTVIAFKPQTITFPTLSSQSIGITVALGATASSGLPVAYASSTPVVCTISGSNVTASSAGLCSLTASQPGNATYAAATPVTQSFVVIAPSKSQQTITFNPIPDHTFPISSFPITATASSGLPVSFSSTTLPVCTVSGNSLVPVSAGACTITASQAGNANYNPAVPVTQTFHFISSNPTVITSVQNAASYALGALAPGSYAVIFGTNLAKTNDPYTFVELQDVFGGRYEAKVIYASAGQVNFLVPDNTPAGSLPLTLTSSIGVATFTITIGPISPGLFTVDPSATMPAAQVVVGEPDGSQNVQAVASCAGGTCALVPIALDPAAQTYLILYGTGIRGRTSLSGVSISMGGLPATVSYAGSQGDFPGLDQINVLVPPSLAGRGLVDVKLAIFGTAANTVQVMIQ